LLFLSSLVCLFLKKLLKLDNFQRCYKDIVFICFYFEILHNFIPRKYFRIIAKTVFTLEQNNFLRMSYYRNGVKRDGEWTYSIQACKEKFLAKSPSQLTYIELLIVLLLPVMLKRRNLKLRNRQPVKPICSEGCIS
jgi:hypothetical protein